MSIKKHLTLVYPLLIIPLIIVTIWFRNGLILGGGDESFIFYNPSISLKILNNTWEEYQTGFPFLAWLSRVDFSFLISVLHSKLLIPNFILQAGSFYILMIVGVIPVYFLARFFSNKHKNIHLISLISAIFYLLNPYSVSQIWARGLYAQYFSFALLPLSLLLFILGLEKRRFVFAIFLSFSSVFFSSAFGFVTFIIVLWGVLLFYLIYWILKSNQRKQDLYFGIAFFALAFLVWCLFSIWWLLPLIFSGRVILAGYLENSGENLGTLFGVSRNFTPEIIVRLLQRTYYYDISAFSPIYKSFYFQLISFIPLIFVLVGTVKILRNSIFSNFKFLFILLILGLVVSLGANPPFGWLFVWIFKHVSLLQSFRNPFEKFGLVYVLGYSVIFALGIVSFFENIKNKNLLVSTLLVITCGIYAWPMWTGRVVSFPNSSPGIDVPKYYQDLNNWLSINNKEGNRTLMTPIWPGDGALYQWNNTKYNGIDPMMFLLDTPAISNNPNFSYYHDFMQNIRKYMERINIVPALNLLRIKYVVNRADAITTDNEKQHIKYIVGSIFPTKNLTESGNKFCQNLSSDSKTNGLAWIVCQVPSEKINWVKSRYLHLHLRMDLPANLEVVVRDAKGTSVKWDGRIDSEYSTSTSDWHEIIIPLSVPTEYNSNLDFSKISLLEVFAHPFGFDESSVGQINVSEIELDSGIEQQTNEFRLVKDFGNLIVYEPANSNTPPEFGSLSSVNQVKDFKSLFEEVDKKRSLINLEGFLIPFQNSEKDLNLLFDRVPLTILQKQKISDTRYWIETNGDDKDGLIILSKTFNSEWKLIPGVTKEMLMGNPLDDFNLLERIPLSENDHYIVNGYGNLWKIKGRNTQYAIVFRPQIIADIGSRISIFSIMLLISSITIWQIKKYISSH